MRRANCMLGPLLFVLAGLLVQACAKPILTNETREKCQRLLDSGLVSAKNIRVDRVWFSMPPFTGAILREKGWAAGPSIEALFESEESQREEGARLIAPWQQAFERGFGKDGQTVGRDTAGTLSVVVMVRPTEEAEGLSALPLGGEMFAREFELVGQIQPHMPDYCTDYQLHVRTHIKVNARNIPIAGWVRANPADDPDLLAGVQTLGELAHLEVMKLRR